MLGRRWRPGARAVRVALWVLARVGVLVVLAGAVWLVWKVPPALYAYVPDSKDRASAEATTCTGLIAALAGLAALGSLAVTGLSVEGQLTDRYTKAVAQVSSYEASTVSSAASPRLPKRVVDYSRYAP
jgi:uncharacterized membrane protein YjgN (DUF898 family)